MEVGVAVAGGGIAGCALAYELARRGIDVVVFEKRQEIGAPKRCGEGISSSTVKSLGQEIPRRCIAQEIDGAIVYSPSMKEVRVEFSEVVGYILERKVYDKWLAYRAAKEGARILAKHEVVDVIKEGNVIKGVVVDNGFERFEVRACVTVAADGVESTVSRKAGLNTTPKLVDIDVGFQYEMAGIELEDPHKLLFFFGKNVAPRGYIWVFPKGDDVANVGIGICSLYSRDTAKRYLDRFIEKTPWLRKGSVIEVNAGAIPVGGFLKDMVLDGFLAIGDAAHQVNPIHGGGMKEAQLAARIAADVIKRCFEKSDFSKKALELYNRIWWEERGKELEKVLKVRMVLEKLEDEDLDYLAENLSGDDLVNFAHGKGLGKLAKLLLKRPRLAKVVLSVLLE